MASHGESLARAVNDANRTLEQTAARPEQLVVERMVVSVRCYHAERDEMVKTGRGYLYENFNDDNMRVTPIHEAD